MRLVRLLCAAAAAGLFVVPASAEPATVLAATEMDETATSIQPNEAAATGTTVANARIEDDATALSGHEASDASLSAAVEQGLPEEVEKAEPLERPEPTLFARIDLTTQRMTVRDAITGEEYGPWKISSARGGYKTPTGSYSVNWTSRMHYSKQYHWSPMPYSVFFNKGIATHGTNAVGALGRPASHGCVRLHTKNAKTFYNLVAKHGNKLTSIVVEGKPPYSPVVAERRQRRRYAQPTYSPFSFFNAPTYQPKKRRYRQQYGSSW